MKPETHCYAERKLCINSMQRTPSSLCPSSYQINQMAVKTCSLVRWVRISACFQEKPKMKKTMQTAKDRLWERCKSQHLSWFGGASLPIAWVTWICVKVHTAWRSILGFWRHSAIKATSLAGNQWIFSRTMLGLVPHMLQQCAWLDCLQPRSGSCWNCIAHQEEENLKTVTTDYWAALVLYPARTGKYSIYKTTTINILSSKMLKKCNYKEKWCKHSAYHASVHIFLSCCRHQTLKCLNLQNTFKQFKHWAVKKMKIFSLNFCQKNKISSELTNHLFFFIAFKKSLNLSGSGVYSYCFICEKVLRVLVGDKMFLHRNTWQDYILWKWGEQVNMCV